MTKLKVITSPSGARFTVAADYADKFTGLIGDLEAQGYGINAKASGGYNPRNIRGTNKPSNHAFGRAVDINWDRNALGTKGDIPAEVARSLAAKHGMTWGGDWSRPDPMHFEVAKAGPVPMGQRSLTAYAGVSKTQPPTTGTPQPMPNMLDVGGQAPVMDPAEVARRQQMAKMLMQNGQDTGNMRHWTQALGAVLNSGAGVYQGKQAAEGLAKGQQSGNDALAQLLMGGDASAAVSNPYSSERALKYEMDKKTSGADYGKAGTLFQNPETGEYEAVQFGSDGTIKRTPMSGMTPFKGVGEVDTGTGTEVINKATGETVRSIGKKLFEAERQKGLGDAQAKGEVSWPKVEMGYEQAKLQDQYVVEDIDQALTQAGPWTTGFAGSVGKFVAGSPQSDLAFTLEGIKANLGFDKLQAIRDASPTGGALGAVTERELDLLQSAWGSIAQAQSEEQFKQRLTRLKQIKAQYATLKQRAYEQDKQRFGAAAVPNPQGGQALDPSALQGRGNQPLLAPQGGAPAAPGWSLKRL